MNSTKKSLIFVIICIALFLCSGIIKPFESVAYADDHQDAIAKVETRSGVQSSNPGSPESDAATQRHINQYKSRNPFEITVVDLFLAIGDMFCNLLNKIVSSEVTVTRLVYNQVDLFNCNLFNGSNTGSIAGADVKAVASKIYKFFNEILVSFFLIALLAIGIYGLLNSTSAGLSKVKQLLLEWLKGLAVSFCCIYIMALIMNLNEILIEMLRSEGNVSNTKVGVSYSSEAGEWSTEEIEFRSPEYVSRYTGKAAFGSDEASKRYVKRLSNYEQNFDLIRIMRAYAGLTKKFIYVFIWYILIGQLLMFIFIYLKRFFIVIFLIAVFPIVCIFYTISLMKGTKPPEISAWFREYCSNVFMQFIHAVIYTIITGFCVDLIREDMVSSGAINWILIIISINFIPEGEKIVKKMIKAVSSNKNGMDSASKSIRGAASETAKVAGNIFHKHE